VAEKKLPQKLQTTKEHESTLFKTLKEKIIER
jgi:hypothetical protein